MKAPEKIYLQENTTTDCYCEFWPEWFEARAKDSDIEYARTDAFIDKACKWLEDNYPYYFEHTSIESELTFGEEFRKAMEE